MDEFVASNGFIYQQQDFEMQPLDFDKAWIIAIRNRIEQAGTTLSDLNVKIRLGLATGDNNAFILDEAQREMLISTDKRNEEIIKPIYKRTRIFSDILILPHNIFFLQKWNWC